MSTSLQPSVVREEIQKIVKSTSFNHSARMQRFLVYVVEETLAGRGRDVKEYTIALNVYDKPEQFDPRTDSIIRVEANRLRAKLEKYYAADGDRDPVVIELPKNSYVPRFSVPGDTSSLGGVSGLKPDWEMDYLKGKHFLSRRDPAALHQAILCFTSAATKRPAFCPSMAGLADCYTSLAWLEFSDPEPVWSQAVLCARRALAGTPPHRQALTTLACENAIRRWDWATSEDLFQEVLKLDPSYVPAYQRYATYCLAPQGRFEESLYYLQQAQHLEPNCAVTMCHTGRVLYLDRKYPEAARSLQQSIRLNPKLVPAYWNLGLTFAHLERWADAAAVLEACVKTFNEPVGIAVLGFIRGISGASDAAAQSRHSLMELARLRYVSAISFALVEIGLGQTERAFEQLFNALDSRPARIIHLPVDPAFDSIKTDPRFIQIVSRLGL